jgi:hypothetical protein
MMRWLEYKIGPSHHGSFSSMFFAANTRLSWRNLWNRSVCREGPKIKRLHARKSAVFRPFSHNLNACIPTARHKVGLHTPCFDHAKKLVSNTQTIFCCITASFSSEPTKEHFSYPYAIYCAAGKPYKNPKKSNWRSYKWFVICKLASKAGSYYIIMDMHFGGKPLIILLAINRWPN